MDLSLSKKTEARASTISVHGFSGDDQHDTELDLAKAYIELKQYDQAKHLLKSVITLGQPHQIQEGRKMFAELLKQELKEESQS